MWSMSEMPWFALRVKSRHEKSVASSLQSRDIEELLPLYVSRNSWADRYKNVHLPLFPGYVFSRFEVEKRGAVLRTPGVIDLVRFGDKIFPVDPKEMEALQRLAQSGLACEPYAHVEVGERVEIRSGPFFGLTGLVTEVRNAMRLVLSVTLLRRSVLVELDRDWVRAERKAAAPSPSFVPAHARIRPEPLIPARNGILAISEA
jgi:transcription antitermination factor NusG